LVLYARTGLVGFHADMAVPGFGHSWQAATAARQAELDRAGYAVLIAQPLVDRRLGDVRARRVDEHPERAAWFHDERIVGESREQIRPHWRSSLSADTADCRGRLRALGNVHRRREMFVPSPAVFRGHTATIDHSLFGLELGLHMTVVDPAVVLPAPSSAVPVPRLTMW
jgi:hypothetical protein